MSLIHVNKKCVLIIVIGITAAILVVGSVVLIVLCFHWTDTDASSAVVQRFGAHKGELVASRNPVNGTVFLPFQYTTSDNSFPPEGSPELVSVMYEVAYTGDDGHHDESFVTQIILVGWSYYYYDEINSIYAEYGENGSVKMDRYVQEVFKNMTDYEFTDSFLNDCAHKRGCTTVLDRINALLKDYFDSGNTLPFHLVNNSFTFARPFKTD